MTRETAMARAQVEADLLGVTLIVTYNPYGEGEHESDNYGYLPEGALKIFTHETVVATISPEKDPK